MKKSPEVKIDLTRTSSKEIVAVRPYYKSTPEKIKLEKVRYCFELKRDTIISIEFDGKRYLLDLDNKKFQEIDPVCLVW